MRLLVTLLCFLAWPAAAAAHDVYVVNQSTTVSPEALADALPAFQLALDRDFVPEWNAPATLRVDPPPPGAWVISLVDYPDMFFAAGYHSVTPRDVPYAVVGTLTGLDWQLVFTHELFEMLADPRIDRAAVAGLRAGHPSSSLYLMEVGDPVESPAYAYAIPSVQGRPVTISDFVTESWYDGTWGKHDFTHATHRAHELLPGGYVTLYQDLTWQQLVVHGRPAHLMRPGWMAR